MFSKSVDSIVKQFHKMVEQLENVIEKSDSKLQDCQEIITRTKQVEQETQDEKSRAINIKNKITALIK